MANVQQSNVFISPESCGSSIGYYITTAEYTPKGRKGPTTHSISATVVLADCSHKIDWYFGEDHAGLEKIDNALRTLQDFRKKYYQTQRRIENLNEKEKKKYEQQHPSR